MQLNGYGKKLTFGIFFLLISWLLLACGETNSPTVLSLVTPTAPPASPTLSSPTTLPATTAAPTATAPATATPPATKPSTLPTPTATPELLDNPALGVVEAFSSQRAFDHLNELAVKIGVRAAGTEGEKKAGDYIENYFRQLGLTVSRPAFQVANTEDKGSKLSYKSGTRQNNEITGNALILSGNGKVTAPLAFIDYGRPTDITAGTLQGRIVLIERGEIPFEQKVRNAQKEGAVGVIIYNNTPSQTLRGQLASQATIPVLGINKEAGEKLRDELLAQTVVTVELNVQLSTVNINMTNVVGVRPALENPQNPPLLIIGGHYDSVPAGPGANDNGSGTAIVLELARSLKNRFPKYELRFIAFAGEEIGLTGSENYVKNMPVAERQRVIAMLNIDMVAVGNTFLVGGTPALVKLAQAAGVEFGAGNLQVLSQNAAASSDNYSFQVAGMPTLFFNREDDPNYHKPTDTVDKVKPERLQLVGDVVTKVIDELSKN